MEPTDLLALAQRLQAIAQTGITYHANAYDLERFEEIRTISARLLAELTDEPLDKIIRVFASETGYATPKVDVRAVIFKITIRSCWSGRNWTRADGHCPADGLTSVFPHAT